MRHKVLYGAIFAAAMMSACETTAAKHTQSQLPAAKAAPACANDKVEIRKNFIAGNFTDCSVSGNAITLTIIPEDVPINDSAWYAFRIDPKTTGNARINLKYKDGSHRYQPKISYDGKTWNRLPKSTVEHVSESNKKTTHARLTVPLDGGPFIVAAQEIFSTAAHDAWTNTIAQRPDTQKSVIGKSMDGHPLSMLSIETAGKNKPYVMFVGRQHPPEITGALALIPFAETVLDNSALSKKFREHFNILIIPQLNPDGVDAGYWRHNKGGKDLNRDWGPFTQPETQAVQRVLTRFDTGGDKIKLFADFHSTKRNLVYTHTDTEPTNPPHVARDWMKAVDARLDDKVYPFVRRANAVSAQANSKNYMYTTYGIPAVTYEVGDETDRTALTMAAKVFAEEMMTLMLKHEGVQ